METPTSKMSQQNEPKAVEDVAANVAESKEAFSASTYTSGHLEKLPIGLLSPLMDTVEAASVVKYIGQYQGTNNVDNLYLALRAFGVLRGWSSSQMILEAALLSEDLLEDLAWPVSDSLHAAMHSLLCFLQPNEPNCKYDSYFVLYIIKAIAAHMFVVAAQQQEQTEVKADEPKAAEPKKELQIPNISQKM